MNVTEGETKYILDFKISQCSECCNLSFGWFPGVWILCADVSENPVSSIFLGGGSKKKFFLLTPHMKTEQSVPKRRHILIKQKEMFPAYITYEDGTVSRKVGIKIQKPGNYLKERIQLSTCLWPGNRRKDKITAYRNEINPLNMWPNQILGNDTSKSILQARRN
jgi:hypothetical protein